MPSAESKKKAEILEVYTFAGYSSGKKCRVKKQNGEILEATLETNGLIKTGQIVCCFRSGNDLIVRGMNKPYPEDQKDKPTIESGKIKILYTQKTGATLDLYIGGDRERPKLIHKFPKTAKVTGLCHNHGKGDKYAIGVVAEIDGKKQIRSWVKGGKNEESTTDLNQWKSDRILPYGQAQFADPWLPKTVESGWLFSILNEAKTEKYLCFFSNTEVFKIKTVPASTPIVASVVRKKENDYQIIIKAGAETTVLNKAAIEGMPKLKPKEWVWDAIEYPIDGNTVTDPNMTGNARTTAVERKKALILKLWDFVTSWKSTTAKLDEDSRKTGDFWREKKVAVGTIANGGTPHQILLKREADRSPGFPDGSPPPPPGPNPLEPYAGWTFSFAMGAENGWNGSPFNYLNAGVAIGSTPRSYPNDDPWWEQQGVGIAIEYKPGWLINPPQSTNQWTYFGSDPFGAVPPENPGIQQYLGYEPHELQVSETPLFDVYNGPYRWYRWNGVNPIPAGMELRQAEANFYQVNYYLTPGGQPIHWWPFQDGLISATTQIINFDPTKPRKPAPPANPKDPEGNPSPTWQNWSIDDYKWAEPIVLGKSGELLFKSLIFADWEGNPLRNKPATKKDDRLIKLRIKTSTATTEATIKGKLPLLCAEDTLIGKILYRVDRSVFYPETPADPVPKKSTFKKLPVEIYSLSENTEVVIKNAKIFKIPDNAEILSASFWP
ncbi:MAG: hypothetical protein ACRC62_13155 [Microcoleus sp.]